MLTKIKRNITTISKLRVRNKVREVVYWSMGDNYDGDVEDIAPDNREGLSDDDTDVEQRVVNLKPENAEFVDDMVGYDLDELVNEKIERERNVENSPPVVLGDVREALELMYRIERQVDTAPRSKGGK
jgi:hypothetical protein